METQQTLNFEPEAVEPTAAQNRRLLAYLRSHNAHSVDPITAWAQLGIYRLGARIFDLRQAGHKISTERMPVTNRFGEQCFVAYYKLEAK
jgi:hypothetical protein